MRNDKAADEKEKHHSHMATIVQYVKGLCYPAWIERLKGGTFSSGIKPEATQVSPHHNQRSNTPKDVNKVEALINIGLYCQIVFYGKLPLGLVSVC